MFTSRPATRQVRQFYGTSALVEAVSRAFAGAGLGTLRGVCFNTALAVAPAVTTNFTQPTIGLSTNGTMAIRVNNSAIAIAISGLVFTDILSAVLGVWRMPGVGP